MVADYGGAKPTSRSDASSDAANAVVDEITTAGGEATAAFSDVSTMEGGREIVRVAVDTYGRIDALVANAGITSTKYIWDLEEQEWDDVIAVNLKGVFSCFQAAARVMIDQGFGTLLSISSGAAFTSPPNLPAYSASKGGVVALTYSVAHAMQRHNVNVNCVIPSAATRMSDSIYGSADMLNDRPGEMIYSDLAKGSYRDPAHVAPTVVYLLGDDAHDITAQVFRAVGYEVQHLAAASYDKSMTQWKGFDVETVARRLKPELGPMLRPLPIPWPEKRDEK